MKKIIALAVALLLPAAGFCEPVEVSRIPSSKTPLAAPSEAPLAAGLALSGATEIEAAALSEEPVELGLPGTAQSAETASLSLYKEPEALKTAPPSGQTTPLDPSKQRTIASPIGASSISQNGDESLVRRTGSAFDGSVENASRFSSAPTVRKLFQRGLTSLKIARASTASALAGGSIILAAVPALAAGAPSAAGSSSHISGILHALGASVAMKSAAAAGYGFGNGLGMVVDYPRLRAAAESKNPQAVSLGSNAILMTASILMAARAFLSGETFWAWQNLVSGVLPMAIELLKHEKTRKFFPEGPPASDGASRCYSRAVTNKRLALLILYGAIPTAFLGLLGQVYLAPLALGVSPIVPFLLMAAASGGFIYYLVPQIKQIKASGSTEGLGASYYAGVLAICACLGFWALDKALLEIRPGLLSTVASLDFWSALIYAVQGFLGSYIAKLTLDAIAKARGQRT